MENGGHAEAEQLVRSALDAWTRTFGEVHARTARGHCTLGRVLRNAGRLEEAERHARRAVQIWTETAGAEHASTSLGLYELGQIHLTQKRWPQAEEALRKAEAIQRAQPAGAWSFLPECLLALADALRGRGDEAGAKRLEDEAESRRGERQ